MKTIKFKNKHSTIIKRNCHNNYQLFANSGHPLDLFNIIYNNHRYIIPIFIKNMEEGLTFSETLKFLRWLRKLPEPERTYIYEIDGDWK